MRDLTLLAADAVIDGLGGDPLIGGEVLVDGDRITHLGPRSGHPADGSRRLDLSGCTILPGLIDAHTHFGIAGDLFDDRVPLGVAAAQMFANLSRALDAGFTTVRDTGGLDGGVAQAVRTGLLRGPRILPSGPIISEAGGNGDVVSPFGCGCQRRHTQGHPGLSTIGAACHGPDDARVAARMALRRGATQLKVSVNTLFAHHEEANTELTVEEVAAVVHEAVAKGTYVTAHALNPGGLDIGLRAGVRCFEHGGVATEAVADAMARAGAVLVPTMTNLLLMEQGGNEVAARSRREIAESLIIAKQGGITLGLGTDLEGPDQGNRGLEISLRAALESPMEALVAATSVNAGILRLPDIGRVASGACADLIAVDGDPLEHPEILADESRIVLVMQGGQIVKDLRAAAR